MKIKEISTGLQHIGIPTECMDATLEFYGKLGFEVAESGRSETGERVNFLKLGNMVIETYEVSNPSKVNGAIDHIAINVTDVKAALTCVNELSLNPDNASIESLPFWTNGVSFFTIVGPNGEKVEFNQFL